jgi:hypothetical protein
MQRCLTCELHEVTPELVDSYFESLGEHELKL